MQRLAHDEPQKLAVKQMLDTLQDQGLDALREDYGDEFAGAIRGFTSKAVEQALAAQQAQFEAQMTPLREAQIHQAEQQVQQAVDQEIGRLSKAHPDWQQVNASPEFETWLQQQPPGIQQLRSSDYADDNIHLLNAYKSSRKAQSQTTLADHAELPRKGAGKATSLPDDPVELFNSIT
jgi:hypothetical protein